MPRPRWRTRRCARAQRREHEVAAVADQRDREGGAGGGAWNGEGNQRGRAMRRGGGERGGAGAEKFAVAVAHPFLLNPAGRRAGDADQPPCTTRTGRVVGTPSLPHLLTDMRDMYGTRSVRRPRRSGGQEKGPPVSLQVARPSPPPWRREWQPMSAPYPSSATVVVAPPPSAPLGPPSTPGAAPDGWRGDSLWLAHSPGHSTTVAWRRSGPFTSSPSGPPPRFLATSAA